MPSRASLVIMSAQVTQVCPAPVHTDGKSFRTRTGLPSMYQPRATMKATSTSTDECYAKLIEAEEIEEGVNTVTKR
ncbi:hypothetical protein PC9H_011835 [Pleurotus ostreatus]|uniref:Uncharacterized protein n=1 Tax=Pleurotus ostreatus TaxID=5322 RepID=A0A8H6ZMJ1_PLEOS|nr:uncharacterized protein PC9H_011835 [Pleurotus ostreatus]KAF7421313.1 hypothetical protein PC9H_011835 [Pleurotus ostreatus]